MIEVEQKFILNTEEIERLTRDAEFISEKAFTDIYYDTNDYSLTIKDKWLRSRDGKFELKIPLTNENKNTSNLYDEIVENPEIRRRLVLSDSGDITKDLTDMGYEPFCVCKTTRKKYKKDRFLIDLDTVDFDDFKYNIAEVELLVDEDKDIKDALDKIRSFAEKYELKMTVVRGKVIEYLRRTKPEHYRVLVTAGVVKDY